MAKIQKHYTFNATIKPKEKTEASKKLEEEAIDLYIEKLMDIANRHNIKREVG